MLPYLTRPARIEPEGKTQGFREKIRPDQFVLPHGIDRVTFRKANRWELKNHSSARQFGFHVACEPFLGRYRLVDGLDGHAGVRSDAEVMQSRKTVR